MASAGQLLDVQRRTLGTRGARVSWASIRPCCRRSSMPAPAWGGCAIADLGLPGGIDVIAGGGDTQLAATGAGGLADGVVSVVAGTTTPLQASTAEFPRDPEQHPWVSAHLRPDRWAAETNAGYTGMSLDWFARISGTARPHARGRGGRIACLVPTGITAAVTARIWSEETWSIGRAGRAHRLRARARAALTWREPSSRHTPTASAGTSKTSSGPPARRPDRICLLGGAARSRAFTQLVADTTGRPIGRVASDYPAGRAFAWLAASAGTPESSQAPPLHRRDRRPPPQRRHSRRATCDTPRPVTPCARRSRGGRHEGTGDGRVPQGRARRAGRTRLRARARRLGRDPRSHDQRRADGCARRRGGPHLRARAGRRRRPRRGSECPPRGLVPRQPHQRRSRRGCRPRYRRAGHAWPQRHLRGRLHAWACCWTTAVASAARNVSCASTAG